MANGFQNTSVQDPWNTTSLNFTGTPTTGVTPFTAYQIANTTNPTGLGTSAGSLDFLSGSGIDPSMAVGASPNFGNDSTFGNSSWDNFTGGLSDALPSAKTALSGLQAIGGIMSGYAAYKNAGLARDQLNFNKQVYNQNYAAQQKITNSQLADRQQQRLNADPTATNSNQSVDSYMAKYGI